MTGTLNITELQLNVVAPLLSPKAELNEDNGSVSVSELTAKEMEAIATFCERVLHISKGEALLTGTGIDALKVTMATVNASPKVKQAQKLREAKSE
jgi:ABC-type uncharacterized transport system ATPase subunit